MKDGELLSLRERICWCRPVVPACRDSAPLSSSRLRLLHCQTETFHIVRCLNKKRCLGVVVFPLRLWASFNCQTWLFGKLLKPNVYMTQQIPWLLIIVRTFLFLHIFYTLVILNQTFWSQIRSNCLLFPWSPISLAFILFLFSCVHIT